MEKHVTAGRATDDKVIWRMSLAYWISKASETQTEYVIFIAVPHQQRLYERVSVLS